MTTRDRDVSEFKPNREELEVLAVDYLEAACHAAFGDANLSEVDSMDQCQVRPNPRLKDIEAILGEERMCRIRYHVFGKWDERMLNAHDLCRGHGVEYARDLGGGSVDWLWQNSEPNRLTD